MLIFDRSQSVFADIRGILHCVRYTYPPPYVGKDYG